MAAVNPGVLTHMVTRGLRTPIQNKAKRGIFCGKHIGFGNNVSFSQRKTRRTFKPNVQSKNLYSDILEKRFKVNVTTHALRCIKKAGSFDKLLLEKPKLITDSNRAQEIKAMVLERLAEIKLEEKEK